MKTCENEKVPPPSHPPLLHPVVEKVANIHLTKEPRKVWVKNDIKGREYSAHLELPQENTIRNKNQKQLTQLFFFFFTTIRSYLLQESLLKLFEGHLVKNNPPIYRGAPLHSRAIPTLLFFFYGCTPFSCNTLP